MRHGAATTLLQRNSVLAIAILAGLFWTSVLLVTAAVRHGGEVRAFLCLGEHFYHPQAFADIARTSQYGYDGQYYAALATDPLLLQEDTVKALDSPFYRASRIFVPFLAWVVSLGSAGGAIHAYQLLCWALAIGALPLVAWSLREQGRSPWWSLLLVFSGGLAVAILRSTADGAALAFILAALVLHRRGRTGPAIALLCAATLTRETSWLAAAAIAFVELREHRVRQALAYLLAPVAAFGAWSLYLLSVLPSVDLSVGVFGLPFAWLPRKIAAMAGGFNPMEGAGLLAITASLVALVTFSWRPRHWSAAEVTFVAFATLGLFFNWDIYVEAYSYARVLLPLPFLALLIAGNPTQAWRRWTLRAIPIAYLLVGWTVLGGELSLSEATTAARRLFRGAPATETETGPATAQSKGQALYVIPVARAQGYEGANWQTELRIANPARSDASLTVELLLADRDNLEAAARILALAPGQGLEYKDALGELFSVSGAGALRLFTAYGAVTASGRTRNVNSPEPPGPFLPGLRAGEAIPAGSEGYLAGLLSDRTGEAWVRSNLGVLNVGDTPIQIEVELQDEAGTLLGTVRHGMRPRDFHQFTDILRPYAKDERRAGAAAVRTRTEGGALLAYAAVIMGQSRSVTYVLPARRGAPAAEP